ncbi:MAG: hypothetical protein Q8L01_01875 [Candidatus Woesebacteria bacterium]|nr:hypothetical protein [Candidatus Woesebacteria bacterium]
MKIKEVSNKIFLILFLISAYLIYKLIRFGYNLEHIVILIVSVFCILSLFAFIKAINKDLQNLYKKFYINLWSWSLIVVLGILSLYIALYKGFLGLISIFIYFQQDGFIWNLLSKLVIVFIGYDLVKKVADLQDFIKLFKK